MIIKNTAKDDLDYVVKGEKIELLAGKEKEVSYEVGKYIMSQLSFVKEVEGKQAKTVKIPEAPKVVEPKVKEKKVEDKVVVEKVVKEDK